MLFIAAGEIYHDTVGIYRQQYFRRIQFYPLTQSRLTHFHVQTNNPVLKSDFACSIIFLFSWLAIQTAYIAYSIRCVNLHKLFCLYFTHKRRTRVRCFSQAAFTVI